MAASRKRYVTTPYGRAEVSSSQPSSTPMVGDLWLDTSGSSGVAGVVNVRTETSGYTAVETDTVILCDATSAAFTVTLLAASNTGKVYYIKKIDSSANAVTIDGNSSETIDGSTTKVLSMQYDAIMIVSDGTEWWIL